MTEAFKQLDTEHLRPKKLNCNNFETWENGNSITNFMRNVSLCVICFLIRVKKFFALLDGNTWPHRRG